MRSTSEPRPCAGPGVTTATGSVGPACRSKQSLEFVAEGAGRIDKGCGFVSLDVALRPTERIGPWVVPCLPVLARSGQRQG